MLQSDECVGQKRVQTKSFFLEDVLLLIKCRFVCLWASCRTQQTPILTPFQ